MGEKDTNLQANATKCANISNMIAASTSALPVKEEGEVAGSEAEIY